MNNEAIDIAKSIVASQHRALYFENVWCDQASIPSYTFKHFSGIDALNNLVVSVELRGWRITFV